MRIISVRKEPAYKEQIIAYIQQCWSEISPEIYSDCINHCIGAENPLPQWYILVKNESIVGCAGLITNDFISRMDLYPWLAALYIDEKHRGNSYSSLLMEQARIDAKAMGFNRLYLSTHHVGFYEKHGYSYLGNGHHPWGEESRVYKIDL